MAVQTRMTAAEFMTLPETMLPCDLINGEVIMSPAPTLEHQDLVFRLAKLIDKLIPNGKVNIAPVDVHLDEFNVVQPDILWVAEGSTCVSFEGKWLQGGPDLVIEILSPGSKRLDRKEKFHLYEKHGTREYWMVDSDPKLIEIWYSKDGKFTRLDVYGQDETFTSPLLGAVQVNAIFPPETQTQES
jgi:Uma2 family endonuclease